MAVNSLKQRIVKAGGRLVKHAPYYFLLLSEGHLNRWRFAGMSKRIALLQKPTKQADVGQASIGIDSGLIWVGGGVVKMGEDNGNLPRCGAHILKFQSKAVVVGTRRK